MSKEVCKQLDFKKELREEVRRDSRGRCESCGDHKGTSLQIHHRIPKVLLKTWLNCLDAETYEQFKLFIKSKGNAVALCSHDHKEADRLALEEHIFWGFDKPLGIPFDPTIKRGKERIKR